MAKMVGVGRGNNPASWINRPKASRQHRWKPGGLIGSNGYVKVRVGKEHPLADPNGYAYEHLVVWCASGRARPARDEILHHNNGDRTDNRIGNLCLMKRAAHNAHHLREDNRRDTITGRLKRAGRSLDGVEHNGMPEVCRG